MADKPFVHIVDDDDAARESLSFLLDSAGMVSRTYESAEAFLARSDQTLPGCIVTDVRMPGMSGTELLSHLQATGSSVPVIIITGHGDVPLAVEAMKLGAADFIEKPFDGDVMLGSIRAVLARGAGAEERKRERITAANRIAALSARERDVLDGLVAGKPNKVIAFDLGISPRTVEVYRANVMTKLQASSLSDVVRMALVAADHRS